MITVSFAYNNHRGVTEARTIDVYSLDFLTKPGFGYQPGWFLTGRCHARNATRSFALSHIVLTPEESAPVNIGIRIPLNRFGIEVHDMEMNLEDERHSDSSDEGTRSENSTGNDE